MSSRFLLPLTVALLTIAGVQAQDSEVAKNPIRTAADLKSGNSQDVLVSFFQLAIDDFNSDEKSFSFSSSLFGVAAQINPNLMVDTAYLRKNVARNFEFGFATALDDQSQFKSTSVNLKYALLNKRDKSVFDFVLDHEEEWNRIMNQALNAYLATSPTEAERDIAERFFTDDEENPQAKVDELPEAFSNILKSAIAQSRFFRNGSLSDFQGHLTRSYKELEAAVANKPLWTLGTDLESTAAQPFFSGINLSSQFLKGVIKPGARMNFEIDLQATYTVGDDTASTGYDMDRQVVNGSAGFNWVIVKSPSDHKPRLEFKGSIENAYVLSTLHAGEKQNSLTANGTARVRITNEIWVPIEIKYDLENNNVFGFLNVTTNFDWLSLTK